MGKKSRNKGKRGEYEIRDLFKKFYPDAVRHLEFQKVFADEGRDLDNTGFLDIQVKLGSQTPKKVYQFIEQIKDREGQYKLVAMRRDNQKWLVVMELEDVLEWLNIMKANGVKI